jgi:MOSC domain-containing protein
MRRRVATVAELWRYPIKSMRGERLNEMALSARGAAADRLYAMRELQYGSIMSARIWSAMLRLRAVCEREPVDGAPARVRIELPGGGAVYAGDPGVDDTLSALFGHPVRLDRPRGNAPLTPAEIGAIARGDAYLPPRDFYDEDVVHVLASGTLEHLRRLCPSDFDPRRFRPNIYIDTGAAKEGFVEDGWLGGELEVGGSGARIVGMRPALRCAMIVHPQDELRADPAILRTAAQHHGAYVGVFAAVGAPGRVCVGDPVWLVRN